MSLQILLLNHLQWCVSIFQDKVIFEIYGCVEDKHVGNLGVQDDVKNPKMK
jgi:hypothetical protein